MLILWAAVCGFLLDLLLGDPAWLIHPVVLMGKLINWVEKTLRPRFSQTSAGEFRAGVCLAVLLPAAALAVTGGGCALAFWLHPAAGFALQTLWCWQALAMKGLAAESRNVCGALQSGSLPAARKAVARIVGRDTERLSAEGVAKAAIETVAENFSDGVAAPMLYMFLGGAPLAMVYKSINTMDSMVGYQNQRYLYFGRAAAKLDDAVNFLPSRIAACFWIAAAALTGQDGRGAFRMWRRDARCHASPNSAQTESACAGALGVQLAGPAWYFGELYEKPTIGDPTRPVVPEDILLANRMLYAAGTLLLVACAAVRYLAVCLI
ncbi:adenosylcobinamide-phosphate synthase CbiB [uncultured Dysosmobacter sp.]|uniref:adenosylcobinamide-phosphate synthase CbiB n=1 Tax=uncultured Dysosmobacter sp. TaxID=2591384 RepID=UPI00261237C4|nr:adenosylcobinamide-phosphate synthase CbiB [uncultured Dysosmobacter sp.]